MSYDHLSTAHCVIVPAHQRCVIFVLGLAGPHAGDFVGNDADADAAGATQHAQFRAAIGDGLRRRLREIGIIIRRVLGIWRQNPARSDRAAADIA